MYFKKPFTKNYIDVRFESKSKKNYRPDHKIREVIIATCAAIIFLTITLGGAYIIYSVTETGTVNTVSFIRWELEAKVAAQNAAARIRKKFGKSSTSLENAYQGSSIPAY
jgi:hypothetical protein